MSNLFHLGRQANNAFRHVLAVGMLTLLVSGLRAQSPNESAGQKPADGAGENGAVNTEGSVPLATNGAAALSIDYETQIRPIFEQSCFACHDSKKKISGLRLDLRDDALRGGESGAKAIVPGNAEASEMIARVTSSDDSVRMPPADEESIQPLSPQQVDLLKAWIQGGALYPEEKQKDKSLGHWAYRPVVRPEAPWQTDSNWPRGLLDHFVLAKLKAAGLQPSPETDKATWLRRVSLDLIGLPPTEQEIDRFLADNTPEAYALEVDRLLESPHFGEKWGRMWLDAARYADSDGFEKDKQRFVWFYRDWVINAFNRDLPYNQFLIEQLAGDLLPNPTQDQLVATGYLRNSMINEEGGIEPEQFRMEAMYDRMDAIGKGILGITVQCAQCHTHKYDPLTQEEYYRMFAFLNNDYEANIVVYTPEEQKLRGQLVDEITKLERSAKEILPDWESRMAAWEASVVNDQPTWTVVRPEVEADSTGGQKYRLLPDGSFLAEGYAPTHHTVHMYCNVDDLAITGFQIELLNDESLPRRGPGRSIQGTGALSEFKVEVESAKEPGKPEKVQLTSATADVNPPRTPLLPIYNDKSDKERVTGPIEYAIDGVDETAWGIDVGPALRNQPRKAVFVCETPIKQEGGVQVHFRIGQYHGGWNSDDNQNHNLGRFRLSFTTASDPKADPLPARVRQAINIPREDRTPAQQAAVFAYWRTIAPELADVNRRIDDLWRQYPEGANQLVLSAMAARRTTNILKRGNFLDPLKAVSPDVPAFLNPIDPHAPRNRLTFAKWLTSRESPTTARSFVNRVWQALWGVGFVETAEDLGVQSPAPSHPELLDYLAADFMDRGWSVKQLLREITLSAAYRQSSRVTPELLVKDPYNRLLARGPRVRAEAETVRDIALAVSGLMNKKVGGPPSYPPIPDFLMQPPLSYGPKIWREDKNEERYRRAVYTHRYRSVPYPMLQTFDAPNGDFACVRRVRSNTPLQALVLLNEPIFVECAQALADRLLASSLPDDSARIDASFKICVARRPTSEEFAIIEDLLRSERAHFAESPEEAKKLTGLEGNQAVEKAAWTAVARVMINLDETITKE